MTRLSIGRSMLLGAAVLALAACGKSESPSASSQASAPAESKPVTLNMASIFPSSLTIVGEAGP